MHCACPANLKLQTYRYFHPRHHNDKYWFLEKSLTVENYPPNDELVIFFQSPWDHKIQICIIYVSSIHGNLYDVEGLQEED